MSGERRVGGMPKHMGTAAEGPVGMRTEGQANASAEGSGEAPAGMVPHPQVARLRSELARVSGETLDLLARADDIRLQQNPRIEAEYAVKVGYLENELLARQVDVRRARRKLALVQAMASRGARVGAAELSQVERQLDDEFAQWKGRLAAAFERCAKLARRRAEGVPLSPADDRELRRLYHALAKALHPDLNPGLTPREVTLFSAVRDAYARGDVDALRAIWSSVRGLGLAREERESDSLWGEHDLVRELEAQLASARRRRDAARERLEKLEGEEPYALGKRLRDVVWVRGRRDELRRAAEACEESLAAYADRLASLTGGA